MEKKKQCGENEAYFDYMRTRIARGVEVYAGADLGIAIDIFYFGDSRDFRKRLSGSDGISPNQWVV